MEISPHTSRSDRQLLEDLLARVGVPEPAPLTDTLSARFPTIPDVYAAPPMALINSGMPEDAVRALFDARELATRGMLRTIRENPILFQSSPEIRKYCVDKYGDGHIERVFAIYIDNSHRLIHEEVISEGDLNSAHFPVRKFIAHCLHYNAAAVIFGHNHPSAEKAIPSEADVRVSRHVKQALQSIQVQLLDSIVVTRTDAYSMTKNALLVSARPGPF